MTKSTHSAGPQRPPSHPVPWHLKLCTWFNIGVQIAFPLVLASTPSMGSADRGGKTRAVENISSPSMLTQVYILTAEETTASVAKKHGITVNELKKLNQFRTFAKPFATLSAGDELEVPRRASPFSADQANTGPTTPDTALARYAQSGASALASDDLTQSGEQWLRSAASNELNQSTQQWLTQFGTARVQLNLNDDFKLDGSAMDVLLPLYDQPKNLLFTQLGVRHKDNRTTINTGVGWRTFLGDWMLGTNAFFDNDLTGKNRRMGLGAEAWTDYLKLSSNSYFGLTDWHQSRDFADYNERPANGYDVRAEAWLPAYPQLGGKLMYEQYRGEEVALFGKNNRQNNPHAVTAGVNYTPIPLLTVGAEHRAGKGGKNDSSINLQLTYRPGTSWQSHIDPSAVAGSRTLAGSRHDLVERNNDIVLDYQKQELVRVTLPAHVKGEAGATTTVTAQVNSKYALSRIEWDSASLVAAGGTLTSVSPQAVAVRLPVYVATNNSNSYVHTLGAIAYDTQGNTSSRVTLQMTVLPSTASAPQLTVTTDNAVANGSAVNAVQALVTDANGNPLADQVVSFRANNNATITAVTGTTGTDGIATATLTNTTVGTSVVTATLSNSASATVNTTFVADAGTATIADGDFTVTTDNAVANGSATNAVQAIVTDMNSNLLAEQTVTFSVSNGATVTTVIGTTGADGVATATLTNITAGISTVTATLSNSASATVNTTFVADAGTATIADGDFTVTTDNAVANGSAVNALSATVKDAEGNTVPDVYVTFTVTSGSATPASQNVVTDAHGVATATLSSQVAEVNTVTASVRGNPTTAKTVAFVGDSSTATIATGNFTVTTNNALANGRATNAVQAIVTDMNSNLLAEQTVTFSVSNGATVTTVIGTTGAGGVATATLTNITAGISTVTAALSNSASATVETIFVVPVFEGVTANGHTFAVDSGFPRTGFSGAEFTLGVVDSASDYTWSSSKSWATVDNSGKVAFTQKGDTTPVTITATPTAGGVPLTYTFTVGTWFINNGSTQLNWSNASNWCKAQAATQPSRAQLTQGTEIRGIGSLWSEWGRMDNYSSSGFVSGYWSSDAADDSGFRYSVYLDNGSVGSGYDGFTLNVVCYY